MLIFLRMSKAQSGMIDGCPQRYQPLEQSSVISVPSLIPGQFLREFLALFF